MSQHPVSFNFMLMWTTAESGTRQFRKERCGLSRTYPECMKLDSMSTFSLEKAAGFSNEQYGASLFIARLFKDFS